jgi:hypothetical protein
MLVVAVLHLICLKQETPQQLELIRQVTESGRCVSLAESPDARTKNASQIAPGQPPILTFRYYEGKMHSRFGNSDLMLDDAGH